MSDPERQMRMIQGSISERQSELHKVADIIAKAAGRQGRRAAIAKVLVIILGAFAATKSAADQVLGVRYSAVSTVLYTLVGVLIASIAGIEAAFKSESRSAELKIVAATCQSTIRQVDSQWQKEIGTAAIDQQLNAARKLLDLQDTKLADVQERAAKLGVNITLEIRELYRDEPVYLA